MSDNYYGETGEGVIGGRKESECKELRMVGGGTGKWPIRTGIGRTQPAVDGRRACTVCVPLQSVCVPLQSVCVLFQSVLGPLR